MSRLLLVELNEINFDFVSRYVSQDKLPVLGGLINTFGVQKTSSEQRYEELEPWIQWVTAHTGLTLAEHQVFRLGDIVDHDIEQIWEQLESDGLRVGAVSPMNARNRMKSAAFFLPDPWTRTEVTGPPFLRRLHRAVCAAVNANAESRMSIATVATICAGLAVYARASNYGHYARLAVGGLRRRWLRALVLDLLLGDIFIKLTRATEPDFASLFVNAGAHIQHHYLFNSAAYLGPARNPEWYVPQGEDPVLDAYELYDSMIGQFLQALPGYRLIIATGLRQVPHHESTFYWRLRNHKAFLHRIGIHASSVEPRMSRDFIVRFATDEDAARADEVLRSVRGDDGINLFEVDNRGRSLFVMLVYPRDIKDDFAFVVGGRRYSGFRKDVVFVAIKNGEHNGTGYCIDTGLRMKDGSVEVFAISELPARIRTALSAREQLFGARL
jgi:hypothetical protein